MRLGRGLAALGGLAVAIGACSLLNPLDGYTGGDAAPPPTADATSAPADVAAPDASLACIPHTPPERPAPTDTTTSLTVLVAAETLDLGGATDGFDVDGLCTCPGRPACGPVSATARTVCDGDGGLDNSLGPEIQAATALLPKTDGLDPTSGTGFIQRGKSTFFIELRGYNGTSNDDEVRVGVYASGEIEPRDDAGPDAGPRFDGDDTWSVDRDSVLGQGAPPYQPRVEDVRGYVRDGVLVAAFDVDLKVGLVRARIKEARLVAPLVRGDGGTFRVAGGLVTGRVRAGDLLTALEVVKSPLTNTYLCRQDPIYQEAKRRLCAALDVAPTRADDGADRACTAISIAVRFTAGRAATGALVTVPVEKPCGADWYDDCTR